MTPWETKVAKRRLPRLLLTLAFIAAMAGLATVALAGPTTTTTPAATTSTTTTTTTSTTTTTAAPTTTTTTTTTTTSTTTTTAAPTTTTTSTSTTTSTTSTTPTSSTTTTTLVNQLVAICHKGKKTLYFNATDVSAIADHVSHGDPEVECSL